MNPAEKDPPASAPKGEPFFFYYGWMMLAIVLGTFSSHAIVNPQHLPPFTPSIIMHGVVMICWFALFVFQAGMIRVREVPFHQRTGRMSIALAIVMIITGLLVTYSGYKRSGDPVTSMANFTSILTFAVLYTLALLKRRRPAAHKRFLIIGSIRLLAPAFFRICLVFNLNLIFIPVMALVALGGVVTYDIVRLRRLHSATILGGLVFLMTFALVPTAGRSAAWKNLLDSLVE